MAERQTPIRPKWWGLNDVPALQYVRLLIDQFLGWLGSISLSVWILGFVTDQVFSYLPTWLDSLGESLPWILLAGITWGGYQIHVKQGQIYKNELRSLQDRLSRFDSVAPQIEVGFNTVSGINNSQTVQVSKLSVQPDVEGLLREQREILKETYSTTASHFRAKHRSNPFYTASLDYTHLKDEDAYVRECGEYLLEYRSYIESLHKYTLARRRVRPISLAIHNASSSTVRNVVLELRLPPDIRAATDELADWYDDESGELVPERPFPPSTTVSSLFFPPITQQPSWYPQHDDSDERSHMIAPRIRDHAGHQYVRYRIGNVNAGEMFDSLEPVPLLFLESPSNVGVSIDFSLFASEWPQPVQSSLSVNLAESPNPFHLPSVEGPDDHTSSVTG